MTCACHRMSPAIGCALCWCCVYCALFQDARLREAQCARTRLRGFCVQSPALHPRALQAAFHVLCAVCAIAESV
eukprot:4450689-Lingulodinium_polyedra.AAC.1